MDFKHPRGIRFECQRCARCCGDTERRPRRILLTEIDSKQIQKTTGLQLNVFADPIEEGRFTFEMKKINGKCIFLKDGNCQIYLDRPLICRCFPFWIEQANNGSFTFKVSDDCKGIGRGRELGRSFFAELLKKAILRGA